MLLQSSPVDLLFDKAMAEAEKDQAALELADQLSSEDESAEESMQPKASEAVAKKKADEAVAKKKADEAVAKKKADEAVAKKKADEAVAKKKADEAVAKKKADEVLAKEKADEVLAKKKADKENREVRGGSASRRNGPTEPAAKKQRTAEAEHAGSKRSKQPAVMFQVERILNHRKSDSGMQYLVKWESYGEAHNSWEPEDHILDPALLTEYNKSKRHCTTVSSKTHSTTTQRDVRETSVDPNEACNICWKADNEDHMLICDSCNHGFHIDCAWPQLTAVPEGRWMCTFCTNPTTCPKCGKMATSFATQSLHKHLQQCLRHPDKSVTAPTTKSEVRIPLVLGCPD